MNLISFYSFRWTNDVSQLARDFNSHVIRKGHWKVHVDLNPRVYVYVDPIAVVLILSNVRKLIAGCIHENEIPLVAISFMNYPIGRTLLSRDVL